ncbi:Uncharacterised protein [Klebsiella michiganensis]|uniref:Uncharacterized protein n=1 Tax=Klebsiella michiganensis TaxID=1134687 RepID=A0A7H4PLH9_9ENTR|nr:Uncharacterised protein [Klebsiella michiganensis]
MLSTIIISRIPTRARSRQHAITHPHLSLCATRVHTGCIPPAFCLYLLTVKTELKWGNAWKLISITSSLAGLEEAQERNAERLEEADKKAQAVVADDDCGDACKI